MGRCASDHSGEDRVVEDEVWEKIEIEALQFQDDSDLPCETIIDCVRGVDGRVVKNSQGDLLSVADIEMIDNNELSMPEASEGQSGRGKRKPTMNKLYSASLFVQHCDDDASDEE